MYFDRMEDLICVRRIHHILNTILLLRTLTENRIYSLDILLETIKLKNKKKRVLIYENVEHFLILLLA